MFPIAQKKLSTLLKRYSKIFSFHKQVWAIIVVVIGLLAFPNDVCAAVVINEVFPNPSGDSSEANEFVELYNTDENGAVDISGYKLEESKTYTIANVTIEPHGYISFARADTGLALNNSGDTISLRNTEGEIIDSFTFDEIDEDVSWSRYPDGVGDFVLTVTRTPGSANSEPPTPTPTPTLSPTPITSPTLAPSPTDTPTPTITRTPTVTQKPESTSSIGKDATNSDHEQGLISRISENNVLSVSDTSDSSNSGDGGKIPIPAMLFIVGGLVFIGVAVYLKFFKKFSM